MTDKVRELMGEKRRKDNVVGDDNLRTSAFVTDGTVYEVAALRNSYRDVGLNPYKFRGIRQHNST